MAGGTKSVDVTEMPMDTLGWSAVCGQVAADVLNRKRDIHEARVVAKLATTVVDLAHAETRRALAIHQTGGAIPPLRTA